MRDYFLRRLLLIPPTLIGVTIIVFAITRLVPGGPLERAMMESQQMNAAGVSSQVAGEGMALSEAQLARLKEYYGFDKPVFESYADWMVKVAQGDLGSSYRYNEPVLDVISDRFPVSLYYGLMTLVITYMVCIPLGVVKAIKHRTAVDNISSILIFVGLPCPATCLGPCYCYIFPCASNGFPWAALSACALTTWGPGTRPWICSATQYYP